MILRPTPAFTRAVRALDRAEQILVLKSVERISQSEQLVGKPLSGGLRNCRSIRTGHMGRLRVVYSTESGQVIRLLIVGPRERGVVYIQAVQVLKELEQ